MEATRKKVAGRYILLETLGKGGMGAVWRARDEVLKRDIALKEVEVPLDVQGTAGSDINERVLREARAAARLSHPSATTVYDVIEEDGRTFIAMELVDAPTLGALVDRHGPLEPDEVARIGLSLLDALDAAHAVGMVHRDVKPDNVMVTDAGRVKLTDFGIASVKGDPKLTMSGVILGSPSYMAPEQADGKAAGRATDLWALGATLYYAVEGRPPFKKDSPIATLAAVVGEPVPRTSRAGALGPIVEALLAKDPSSRPSSETLRRDLERVAGNGDTAAIATEVVERSQPTRAEPVAAPVRQAPTAAPTSRKRRPPYALIALLALALAGVVVWSVAQRDDEPQRAGSTGNQQQGGSADTGDGGEEAAPEGNWTAYPIADTGYQISYPEGWEVSESGTQITFSDPESATSFLVEYTTAPGDDAVAAWEAQAASFAEDHADYSEITIEPTSVEGFDTAAIWEFTYSSDGLPIHAIDIGMANDEIGFAHFFQTSADEWDAEQATLQQFRDSFGPA
jgi:hypothetical protein